MGTRGDFKAARKLLGGLRTDIRRWTQATLELVDKTLEQLEGSGGRSNQVKALRRSRQRVQRELSKLDSMELRVEVDPLSWTP